MARRILSRVLRVSGPACERISGRNKKGFYLILDRVLHPNDGFLFLSLILFDDRQCRNREMKLMTQKLVLNVQVVHGNTDTALFHALHGQHDDHRRCRFQMMYHFGAHFKPH